MMAEKNKDNKSIKTYLQKESSFASEEGHRNFDTYENALSHLYQIISDASSGDLYIDKEEATNLHYYRDGFSRLSKAIKVVVSEAVDWNKYFSNLDEFPLSTGNLKKTKSVLEHLDSMTDEIEEELTNLKGMHESDVNSLFSTIKDKP